MKNNFKLSSVHYYVLICLLLTYLVLDSEGGKEEATVFTIVFNLGLLVLQLLSLFYFTFSVNAFE